MKSLFKIFVAISICALAFGCVNPFSENTENEEEETQGGEGAINKVEKTIESQQETQEIKEEVEEGYNVAQEFTATMTFDDGSTEDVLVVTHSNKAGDETIMLVAEKSHSEATVRRWLGQINENISELQQKFCSGVRMVTRYDELSAAIVYIKGSSRTYVKNPLHCGVSPCDSKVRGMYVTVINQNEAGTITSIMLNPVGNNPKFDYEVPLNLDSVKESDMNLALYKKFLDDIQNPNFCAELKEQEGVVGDEETQTPDNEEDTPPVDDSAGNGIPV